MDQGKKCSSKEFFRQAALTEATAQARFALRRGLAKHEDHESGWLRDTVGEDCSVAPLMLVMALVFTAYFAMVAAMPELSLPVQQALTLLPS